MKTKTKKPKLISSPFTSLGINFSPGDPSLVAVRGFDVTRLSAKLAKLFRKVEKRGTAGVKVKDLDRYRRWNARFLLKIKALREVPEPKGERAAKKSKAKAGVKAAPAKGNPLAKAA